MLILYQICDLQTSPITDCHTFTLLILSYDTQNLTIFMKSDLLPMLLVSYPGHYHLIQDHEDLYLCFFSKSFIVLALTFKPTVKYDLIFVYGVM